MSSSSIDRCKPSESIGFNHLKPHIASHKYNCNYVIFPSPSSLLTKMSTSIGWRPSKWDWADVSVLHHFDSYYCCVWSMKFNAVVDVCTKQSSINKSRRTISLNFHLVLVARKCRPISCHNWKNFTHKTFLLSHFDLESIFIFLFFKK